MEYYRQPPSDTLHALDSTPDGLTPAQAAARLARDGRNVLTEPPKPSLVKRFFQQLADPMTLVLLAAALISAITSVYAHESFADVIIILIVVIINAVLGVYQESKAEQAIAALKELSAAHSRVLRGGKLVTVPSEELVVGDVLVLEAGDAVPADARVLESTSLRAEEAALTGESVPAAKSPDALTAAGDIGLGDRSNMLYLGSSIVYGRGRAVVTETGMQTQMGHIADALTQTKENKTPLQLRLTQLSRILTWLVLGICAVVFAVGVLRTGTINGRVVLDTFLIAVSLAVAAIPEGLAAVVTIVLSIGVTNMSRRGAVIRRLTAVETLGCAQVICSDKTGTLTQNRMTVTECAGSDEHLLATAMALCVDAVHDPETDTVTGEPTEAALVRWAVAQGLSPSALRAQYPRVAEAPFDSERKRMSTLHADGSSVVQYTKGAPDVLLPLCDRIWIDGRAEPMTDAHRAEIAARNYAMTGSALRVLAAAMRTYDALPGDTSPAALEQHLCFLGLTGMIDPVRPEVVDAIRACRSAGIRPVMITGDHVDTAKAIARELGLLGPGDEAVTGTELRVVANAPDKGTLSYEWHKVSGGSDSVVGSNSATYTANDAGEYYVVVTNTRNSLTATTKSATCNVGTKVDAAKPTFGTDLKSTGYVGDKLTVKASVTDKGTVSYQWCKNDMPLSGKTGESYTPTEAGKYYVIATNTKDDVNGDKTAQTKSPECTVSVKIGAADMNLSITAPTNGATIADAALTDSASSSKVEIGTPTWEKSDDGSSGWASATGTFEQKFYRATVTLTAKDGFAFGESGDYSSLTVNNGSATSATVSDGSLKLVITFDQVQ